MLYFIVRRGIIARYRCKNTSSQSAAIFGKGWREKRRTEVGGGGKKKECNKRLIKGDMQKRGMCASWSVRSDALCWYTRELFFRRMIFTEEKATSLSSLLFFFFFLYIPLFRCYFICSLWKKEEILVSIGGQRNMYHLSSNSCFSRVFVFSVSINLLLSCSLHVHLSLSLSLSLFLSYCLPLVWEHDLLYIMPLLFSRERITRNVTV